MDLSEAAHQARMSIGLGDEQLEIDDLGRMDDWPRQAAAQGPGRIDRREAANVGQRAVGDVMPEGGNRVRTGAALVDRGGYPGIPSSLRRRERARPATFSTPSRRSPTSIRWSAVSAALARSDASRALRTTPKPQREKA